MPRPFGLLLAALALVGQLALGAVAAPEDAAAAQLADLDAVGILCSGQAPDPGHPVPHRHHAADLSLCPLHVAMALPGLLPAPGAVFAAPVSVHLARSAERPPGRGPPPESARVGEPRAPPFTA